MPVARPSTLLRRYPKLLLIVGILLAVAVVGLVIRPNPTTTLSTGKGPVDDYTDVVPGKTSQAELLKIGGQPYNQYDKSGYTIISYFSAQARYSAHRFYLKNGTVMLKELHYSPVEYIYKESQVLAWLGQPETRRYDTSVLPTATQALLYPHKGMAVFIQLGSRAVYQVQYFPVMSLASYLRIWGSSLKAVLPANQNSVDRPMNQATPTPTAGRFPQ